MEDKYFTIDYWKDRFKGMGFKLESSHTPNWGLGFRSEHWYVGIFLDPDYLLEFHLIRNCVLTAPKFTIRKDGGEKDEERLREFLLVVDVIADPDKAPLLAGIEGVGEIMSHLLSGVAAIQEEGPND